MFYFYSILDFSFLIHIHLASQILPQVNFFPHFLLFYFPKFMLSIFNDVWEIDLTEICQQLLLFISGKCFFPNFSFDPYRYLPEVSINDFRNSIALQDHV